MKYYICQLIFKKDAVFILQYEDETNGVKMEDSQLVYVYNIPPLLQYGELKNLLIDSNSITQYEDLDFNELESWLEKPHATISCEYFLNLWNILIDTLASQNDPSLFLDLAEDEDGILIYNKLFWGANLPEYTPPGKIHISDWQLADISNLQAIFKSGLEELKVVILNGLELQ
ncbi:MAG: hypothetical protein JKY01_00315 [Pseudomonadales bacterium]|nr:hypothetical protein [Pseudomonadales bacterium]